MGQTSDSEVHFGSHKMLFRHPDRCPLVTGFTVYKSLNCFFLPEPSDVLFVFPHHIIIDMTAVLSLTLL